ncbi:MAG: tetratricopeptide repeat protein [Bacteroidia bacterium]
MKIQLLFILMCLFSFKIFAQTDSTYFVMAKKAFAQENYKDAIDYFSKDIALNPKSTTSYYARALCYKYYKKYDKAISDLNSLLKIDSTNSDAYNTIGNIYNLKGDFKSELPYYNKALKYDSTYSEAYNNRAVLYETLKKYPEAEKDYQHAIRLHPEPLYYTNIGNMFYSLKQYKKAVDAADKAIELDVNYKDAYSLRSDSYSQLDEYDKSDADRKKVKTLKNIKKACDCPESESAGNTSQKK